jgi:dolichol-phosphate mannosyltransferase
MLAVPGLACPACRGDLRAAGEARLICAACGASYPVFDGIPSFVPTPHPDPPPQGGRGSDRENPQLTVLISAHNQEGPPDRLLAALREELRSLAIDHELMVMDRGSPYGRALRRGLEQAAGDYVLTLDADGSHDPSFLEAIWAARTEAEVVIASRYVEGGSADMPRTRRALSRILNRGLRRGLSLPYLDLSSGYRLYRRAAVQALPLQATGFDILQEILIRMVADGYRIREVPFRYQAPGGGRAWLARFAASNLKTFGAMWKLRNSIASADYDARAYDSVIPLQRYWQRRRYQLITTMAAGAQRVLDVGCGSSRIIGSGRMVALDIVLAKLRYARRFGNPVVHGSIFELPFKDGAFDCVICSEVVEHVPADERVFGELVRVLEPGGRLILGTPDYDRWRWRALEWLYGRLSPGGYADEHITHYGRTNLAAYLQARGMQVEAVKYVAGSEMVFRLRKSAARVPVVSPLPVAAGLRGARGEPVASGEPAS